MLGCAPSRRWSLPASGTPSLWEGSSREPGTVRLMGGRGSVERVMDHLGSSLPRHGLGRFMRSFLNSANLKNSF